MWQPRPLLYLSAAWTQWSASPSQAAAISVFVISIGTPTPTCQIQPLARVANVERQRRSVLAIWAC